MLLSVWSAADRPNRRRGSWPFDQATNRHQRTRIAVAIDQNATAIPWLVARDLLSVLVLSGCCSSTNRYIITKSLLGKTGIFAIVLRLFQIYVWTKMYEQNCRDLHTIKIVKISKNDKVNPNPLRLCKGSGFFKNEIQSYFMLFGKY